MSDEKRLEAFGRVEPLGYRRGNDLVGGANSRGEQCGEESGNGDSRRRTGCQFPKSCCERSGSHCRSLLRRHTNVVTQARYCAQRWVTSQRWQTRAETVERVACCGGGIYPLTQKSKSAGESRHLVLAEGLRPSDSPTRALARRFDGSLRSRDSLARSLATLVIRDRRFVVACRGGRLRLNREVCSVDARRVR